MCALFCVLIYKEGQQKEREEKLLEQKEAEKEKGKAAEQINQVQAKNVE
jgi:hypothetical protein